MPVKFFLTPSRFGITSDANFSDSEPHVIESTETLLISNVFDRVIWWKKRGDDGGKLAGVIGDERRHEYIWHFNTICFIFNHFIFYVSRLFRHLQAIWLNDTAACRFSIFHWPKICKKNTKLFKVNGLFGVKDPTSYRNDVSNISHLSRTQKFASFLDDATTLNYTENYKKKEEKKTFSWILTFTPKIKMVNEKRSFCNYEYSRESNSMNTRLRGRPSHMHSLLAVWQKYKRLWKSHLQVRNNSRQEHIPKKWFGWSDFWCSCCIYRARHIYLFRCLVIGNNLPEIIIMSNFNTFSYPQSFPHSLQFRNESWILAHHGFLLKIKKMTNKLNCELHKIFKLLIIRISLIPSSSRNHANLFDDVLSLKLPVCEKLELPDLIVKNQNEALSIWCDAGKMNDKRLIRIIIKDNMRRMFKRYYTRVCRWCRKIKWTNKT